MRSDWHLPLCTGIERIRTEGVKAHSTQKPEALLYRVILSSSNPGDLVLDPFSGTGTTAAVAKKLGRHWLGIERDEGYVELSRARLAEVQPPLDPAALALTEPRRAPRLPFGALLEQGLLQPGQRLYLGSRGKTSALVMADGTLQSGEHRGSIHEVGRALLGRPCNGWEHWYYVDVDTGERRPVDDLRRTARASMGGTGSEAASGD